MKRKLETPLQLYKTNFGCQDTNHSVTQVACFETTLFFLIKSSFLDHTSMRHFYKTNPLILHMVRMIDTLSSYDVRWIKDTDMEWENQTIISPEHRNKMMACVFHYNMDVPLLIRYLGGNYMAECRDVRAKSTILLEQSVSHILVQHYI